MPAEGAGGYLGKLDPRTGEIMEYRPADGTKIDPHTPAFDHNGFLTPGSVRPAMKRRTISAGSTRKPARYDGESLKFRDAIHRHSGDALHVTQKFDKLKKDDQEALLEFLRSL